MNDLLKYIIKKKKKKKIKKANDFISRYVFFLQYRYVGIKPFYQIRDVLETRFSGLVDWKITVVGRCGVRVVFTCNFISFVN